MAFGITLKQTGIREIDEQHQQLVRYLDRLHDYVGTRHEQAAAFEILDALSNYSLYHFAYEENLLQALRFPGVAAHKTKHQALMREVRKIYRELDQDSVVTQQLMATLVEWIMQHLNEDDQDYVAYFSARRDSDPTTGAAG
jgi:hemerythrin-like metal-binding protein